MIIEELATENIQSILLPVVSATFEEAIHRNTFEDWHFAYSFSFVLRSMI
jgi:hypothetical protein